MEKRLEERFAGVLIKARETNRVFLMLRGTQGFYPLTWGLISGGINKNEDVLSGLKREIFEECRIDPTTIEFNEIIDEKGSNSRFHYYEGFTEKEFIPILDHENLDYMWVDLETLPDPLYPNLFDKILKILSKDGRKEEI